MRAFWPSCIHYSQPLQPNSGQQSQPSAWSPAAQACPPYQAVCATIHFECGQRDCVACEGVRRVQWPQVDWWQDNREAQVVACAHHAVHQSMDESMHVPSLGAQHVTSDLRSKGTEYQLHVARSHKVVCQRAITERWADDVTA